jgi:predicted MFS family arabinose efflux permease
VIRARSAESDLRLILAVQAVRAFVYGFGSVLLGSVLANGGLSYFDVGLVFTSMLAGMALTSIAVGVRGDRFGRRRAYVGLLVTMGVAGTVFALTRSLPILVLAALTGTLSTDPNESGPITSLEQAMLGNAAPELRARVFGRYNAVAYLFGALGSLAAGGPAAFRHLYPSLPPDQRWLLAFPVLSLLCVALARRLSDRVESGGTVPSRPLSRSRRTVAELAVLFGLDSFSGGFVVQTFMVFWFRRAFGASPEVMGVVFFAAGLLQAASSIASGRLASRIGLLNTMVFTHLPSNVLLLLVPFMPTLPLAIAVLLSRFALSQMDVPARQAYVVAMVDPDERTAAAAFTNTARYVARPFGALGAGTLMDQVAQGAPFVVAGGLKIVYDLLLFRTFRKVPLPEERARRAQEAAPTPPRPA